ncbi:Protein phosphatase 1 regulatory subunit 14B, partial [Stegodyphus mimosarum]
MECSIPQAFQSKSTTSDVKNLQPGQSPPKAMLHVNFDLDNEEIHERKKKYLTAKYGQHQMSLIKKRLRVEMWMYDQLQILYDSSEESGNYEVEIDLDELLDIEAEPARREWLRNKLVGVKQSEEAVERFITELLQRAATL